MYKAKLASILIQTCICLGLIATMASCRDTRQLTYFHNKLDSRTIDNITPPETFIQKGDILSIVVYSDNPKATEIYNQPVAAIPGAGGGSGPTTQGGYEVDQDGKILFQGLGPLHVEGLTKKKLIDLLNSKLKDTLLSNPYYSIRFLNLKISVLGEVRMPGSISMPSEKVNILQAIGLAGDFGDFAQRDSIIIIRENFDKKEIIHVNLTSTDVLASPNYYLQHNDVVVVRAIKKKSTVTDQLTQRNIAIATSVLSATAIVINTIVLITRTN